MNKPSVGRIVHYVNGNGDHCAAIINEVVSEMDRIVGLTVMWQSSKLLKLMDMPENAGKGQPPATDWFADVAYDEGMSTMSWHWPERVE